MGETLSMSVSSWKLFICCAAAVNCGRVERALVSQNAGDNAKGNTGRVRNRTKDLSKSRMMSERRHANGTLYQLSYTPLCVLMLGRKVRSFFKPVTGDPSSTPLRLDPSSRIRSKSMIGERSLSVAMPPSRLLDILGAVEGDQRGAQRPEGILISLAGALHSSHSTTYDPNDLTTTTNSRLLLPRHPSHHKASPPYPTS